MFSLFLTLGLFAAGPEADASNLRLNQIQVIGTHNSYHQRPAKSVLDLAIAVQPEAKEWDYSREPLDKQLDHGIRSFELDMHLVSGDWHVMHVPVLDPESSVRRFQDALALIKSWSDAHRGHVPISVLMELKEEGTLLQRGVKKPTGEDLEKMDVMIRETFPADRIITPDDVRRGDTTSILAAIEANGWPTLADSAGKVLFILHETGPNRRAYLEGHPLLEGRAMFVNSEPGAPHAAAIVLDGPDDPRIPEFARHGYLIRTRADTRSTESRSRQAKALASGAHILSTDHPAGEYPEGQAFGFAGQAPARINPVTGPGDSLLREPIGHP